MQDQPHISQPAERGCGDAVEAAQRAVLGLLLEPGPQGPWSLQEIARALGDEVGAADAVAHLHAAGLVHRCRDLVFVTRAAVRFRELAEGG